MSEQPADVASRLSAWRAAVARAYLTGILVVVPVVLVVWIAARPPPKLDAAVGYIVASWVTFLVVRFIVPQRWQSGLVVGFLAVVGLVGPFVMGISPGPFLIWLSAVLLGGAVFGRRAAVALYCCFVLSLLGHGALAAAGFYGPQHNVPADATLFSNWLRLAVFSALSGGMLAYIITGLFERMEAAWAETQAAAARERAEMIQRRKAEERATEAQRLEGIGRLAGGVAHDFNNLLVIIMTWADLLPHAKDDAERKEGLDAIRDASLKAAQLTRQLLSFARKGVTQPRAIDLDAFLTSTLRSVRRVLPIDVQLEHVTSQAPAVRADEGQLGQVVLNLATNACDAMPSGGHLTFRTALLEPPHLPPEAPDPHGRYVALMVTDTGTGMDEQTRQHVFDPFFTTKGVGRGSGLGLASVHGVANQSGGWVHVESSPGKGATFTVAFPVASPEIAAPEHAAAREPEAMDCRVLLVEDDLIVRSTMALALRRAGAHLVEAGSADEALAIARRHLDEFDLLCTDGVMPGLPARVLIDGFRQLYPGVPVLLCSGHVEEALISRGLTEGKIVALPKPFTAEHLVEKVRELTSAARATRATARN